MGSDTLKSRKDDDKTGRSRNQNVPVIQFLGGGDGSGTAEKNSTRQPRDRQGMPSFAQRVTTLVN